jgi:ribosomal protein S21
LKKKYNISVSENDLRYHKGKRNNKHIDSVSQNDILIRRFLKKCKKERIIKEYTEKTSYYKSKAQKRREKRSRAIRRMRREANSKSK